MQTQLNENKKKLQQNAQNSQNKQIANKIFKNLKGTFEGLKEVLGRIEKNRMHQEETTDLRKLLQQKEARAFSEEIRLKQLQDLQLDSVK